MLASSMPLPEKTSRPSAPNDNASESAPPSPRNMTATAQAAVSVRWSLSVRNRPKTSPAHPPATMPATFASTPTPGNKFMPFLASYLT